MSLDVAHTIDAFQFGLTIEQISAGQSASPWQIALLLSNYGIRSPNKKAIDEMVVVAHHSSGLSVEEISAKVKVSERTVLRILARQGILDYRPGRLPRTPAPTAASMYRTGVTIGSGVMDYGMTTVRSPGIDIEDPTEIATLLLYGMRPGGDHQAPLTLTSPTHKLAYIAGVLSQTGRGYQDSYHLVSSIDIVNWIQDQLALPSQRLPYFAGQYKLIYRNQAADTVAELVRRNIYE